VTAQSDDDLTRKVNASGVTLVTGAHGEWTDEEVVLLGHIQNLLGQLGRADVRTRRRLLVHPDTLRGFGSIFGLVIVRSSLVRAGTAHLMLEVG
jgi:hypothetical protein